MKLIKNLHLSLLFCLVATIACAQNKETRQLSSFSKINVGQAIKVYVEKGDKESCIIETEGIGTDEVLTDVSGRSLKIRLDQDRRRRNIDVVVYLTYKEIKGLSINSAASVYSKGTIESDEMEIDISSAGSGQLDVNVDELEIKISSAGSLEIAGNAKYQDIDISSAGRLKAYDLACEDVSAAVSSAGSARIQATNRIDARANSGGKIRYKGQPDKTYVSANSGGSISRVD